MMILAAKICGDCVFGNGHVEHSIQKKLGHDFTQQNMF